MGLKEKIIDYLTKYLAPTFPDTLEKYKELFSGMDDQQIKDYFTKKKGLVRLFVDDDRTKQADVDKLVDSLKLTLEERMLLPYKNNTTTKFELLGLPIQILKLQQMASKANVSTIDTKVRDVNNQAARESKTGSLSDDEVAQIAVYGEDADPIIKELFSPRGDNKITKAAMNEALKNDLEFSLEELPNGAEGRISLIHLDAIYTCMGLATNLIDHINERS